MPVRIGADAASGKRAQPPGPLKGVMGMAGPLKGVMGMAGPLKGVSGKHAQPSGPLEEVMGMASEMASFGFIWLHSFVRPGIAAGLFCCCHI